MCSTGVGSLLIKCTAEMNVAHQYFKGMAACARSVRLVSTMCLCYLQLCHFAYVHEDKDVESEYQAD